MPASLHILGFALILAGWIFSLCLHEFAHALVAYRGGDTTVRDKGYLSFNPLRYAHPVNSLLLPLVFLLMGGIALPGGAVYVNRHLLRSRGWDCAVSLAGPLANVALLLALLPLFRLGLVDPEHPTVTWAAYACLCRLQVTAILFNLLPVPPLDGFGAISAYMEPLARARAYALGNYAFLGLLIAMVRTPFGEAFWTFTDRISASIGIPLGLADMGQAMLSLF